VVRNKDGQVYSTQRGHTNDFRRFSRTIAPEMRPTGLRERIVRPRTMRGFVALCERWQDGMARRLFGFCGPAILPAQLGRLRPLVGGQPVRAATRIELGMLDPRPHRRPGQIEILRDLPNAAVTTLTRLDDLGLELGRQRPPRPRSLPTHALHEAGHPPADPTSPDLGCPSKRVRPTAIEDE